MNKPLNVFESPLNGISLVEASAGTGKTYNITSLYVRALLEQDLDPSQILVTTFTEAATAELKLRLRNRLKDAIKASEEGNAGNDEFLQQLLEQGYNGAAERLKHAIDSFDEAAVFTIHGFCRSLLTEYSLQFGISPDFEVLSDESEILQDTVDDYWRNFITRAEESTNYTFLLSYLIDDGFGPDELSKIIKKVLNYPNARLLPANNDIEKLFGIIPEFTSAFEAIKEIWEKEGQEIKEIYFSGKLHKGNFKESSRKPDWNLLQDFLVQKEPSVAVSNRISRFGSYMMEKGSLKNYQVPDFDFFQAIDHYFELANELSKLKPAFINDTIQKIKEEFQLRKKLGNKLTYNDLLELTENILRSNQSELLCERIRKKYPIALVDEFQDTDSIQYSIFSQIYGKTADSALFMIGDPKQAIYGFRGADIFTYLEARKDVAAGQAYYLENNYRSNRELIKGINELFSAAANPFLINELYYQPISFPENREEKYITSKEGNTVNSLQFIKIDSEKPLDKKYLKTPLNEAVCNLVSELLSEEYLIDGQPIEEKDIAILFRGGDEGQQLQELLRERGIQSVLKSRTSVFSTEEAGELFKVLKAVQSPGDDSALKSALATRLLGYKASEITAISEDESKWSEFITKFTDIKEEWEGKGIDSALELLIKEFRIQQVLAKGGNSERKITNLFHLGELVSKAQREYQYYGKVLLKWLFEQIKDTESTAKDEEQLRLESDENLVQISTIHSAKGLQFPIVLCPFLWDNTSAPRSNDTYNFHQDGNTYIDISNGVNYEHKNENIALAQTQQLAEEIRLAYVAVTRAISACYVFIPNYNKLYASPVSALLRGHQEKSKDAFREIEEELNKCKNIYLAKPLNRPKKPSGKNGKGEVSLEMAEFSRKDIFGFPKMLSYSSIVEGKEQAGTAHDYDAFSGEYIPEQPSDDRFGFPKGANAGTCLHKIFEDVSFENPLNLEEIVQENLFYFNFNESWNPIVTQWVKDVLKLKFSKTLPSLSQLADSQNLKEMEFFFPVRNLNSMKLWSVIRGKEFNAEIIEKTSGFLKGFIDLVFFWEGKYYILDYKSNFLGDRYEDYNQERLSREVHDAGYDLQYHIYTLALHRYLKHRMNNYTYDEYFGGVIYLFLRGADPQKTGSGVLIDRPDSSKIDTLDHYFREGGRP